METLRELTHDYALLLELSDSDDPEDQEAFETSLDGLTYMIGEKADQYAYVIAAINARQDAVNAEIVRLTHRKKAMENSVKRMKERLIEAMDGMQTTKIQTDLHTFSIQKNGGKQPIQIDEADVPDSYKKVILETDTERIRKELEAGNELPFARFQERGRQLRIR